MKRRRTRRCRHPKWARLIEPTRETCALCDRWREVGEGFVAQPWTDDSNSDLERNATIADMQRRARR